MNKEKLLQEIDFKAVRSSGPGGQHVNKTASKVILNWNLEDSKAFEEHELDRLRERLASRLTQDGVLILSMGQSRSQHKNKASVTERFFHMLSTALKKRQKRKKTTVPWKSKRKRLRNKKHRSEKKALRKPPRLD
ncbi:alternative ribosome rescue aminoacyl-tRNA hydrolase ArfB [Croceiramulus getboli]|nr:alternative ribosome rescue aminoacyl-tRNA hydrolase ArfB [Flavobacteriaceae bacterium YJPT1-3]